MYVCLSLFLHLLLVNYPSPHLFLYRIILQRYSFLLVMLIIGDLSMGLSLLLVLISLMCNCRWYVQVSVMLDYHRILYNMKFSV